MGFLPTGVKWRAAASALGGSVAATVFGLLSSIVLARWLGPSGQGSLALLLVYPALAEQLTNMGLRQAAARAVGQQQRALGVIATTLVYLWISSSVVGVLVVWCLLSVGRSWAESGRFDALFAALLVPFLCAQSYAGGILIGRRQIASYSGTRFIPAATQLACIALAWYLLPPAPAWALLSRLGALIVAAAIAFWFVRRAVPGPWGAADPRLARELLRGGVGYGVASFVSVLNYRVGVLTLEWWSDPEQLGYFSIAQASAELLWQIPMAFGVVVFADSLASREPHANRSQTLSSIRLALWSGGAIALLTMLAAPWLVPWLYGQAYAAAVVPLVLLLPGVVAFMTFKVGAFDVVGQGRPLLSVPVLLLGIACNIALAAWLVPRWGAVGAALSTSSAYTLSGLGFLWVYRRGEVEPPQGPHQADGTA